MMECKMIKGLQSGKVVARMIVFALVLGVLMVAMPIVRADTEPNDDFDHAETVTVGSHFGSVNSTTDPDDYYNITVGAGQTLSVEVVPASTLGVELYLYDPMRTQVAYDTGGQGEIVDASWTTNSEEPSYVYYIRIGAWWDSGGYTMDVSLSSQDDAGSGGDAGDAFEAATTIASANGTHVGFLKDYDANDYYKLNVTAGQTLSVVVMPASTLGVELYLYDPMRAPVAYDGGLEGTIVGASWTTNSEEPSYVYYIRIYGLTGSGGYTMDVSLSSQDDAGSGGDAGDALETATEIATGTHSGLLRDADTYDCYTTVQSVTAGQGVYVEITPESTLAIEVWLYDKDKVEKAYDGGLEGEIVGVSDSQVPQTGIYHIKVYGLWGDGTYAMVVSIEPTVGMPTQVPPAENVQPYQDITVSAGVTSVQNPVSNVTLHHRTGEGAWTSVPMTYNTSTDLWDGTIPGFPNCTWVSYKIKAYNDQGDYFEEDKGGMYYDYHVIPEFPSAIVALFMIITLLAILLGKKLQSTKTPNNVLTTT